MEKMKTINSLIKAALESISTSVRERLDSRRIKQVLPHEFNNNNNNNNKMTETKLDPLISLSMSVSLALPLIEQVPKRLYQATDWRHWGQSSRRTATLPPSPYPYVYNNNHNHR